MSNSSLPKPKLTNEQIEQELARIDGINGAAGHELTDPYLRGLLKKQISGELSREEVDRLAREHIASKVYDDE